MSNTLLSRDLDTDIGTIYSKILRVNYTPEDFEERFLQLSASDIGDTMHWYGDCVGFCGIMGRELQKLQYTVQFWVLQLLQKVDGNDCTSMHTTIKVLAQNSLDDSHVDISEWVIYLTNQPARQSNPPSTIVCSDYLEFTPEKTPLDYFLELWGNPEAFTAMRTARILELKNAPLDERAFALANKQSRVVRL